MRKPKRDKDDKWIQMEPQLLRNGAQRRPFLYPYFRAVFWLRLSTLDSPKQARGEQKRLAITLPTGQ